MADQQDHDRIDAEITSTVASHDPFAAAVRATRMPMLITDPNLPDNPIVFANAAFTKLTGYKNDEVIGRNCRFLQGPKTDRETVNQIRKAIEQRSPIETELVNHKKDGEPFWNRLLISPVFDRDGTLTYFFASQFDVTLEKDRLVRLQQDRDALERDNERRIAELTHSEDRLRFILKAGRFGAWTLNLSDFRLIASDTCKENFGRDPQEPFSYADLLASIVDDDQQRMRNAVKASIDLHEDYDIEYKIRTPQGKVRWVQVRGQTFYQADGSPISMAGVSLDITERKRAEEHRSFLADELKHRIKNSMITIQSIVQQTLRNTSNVDEARQTLGGRLRSLSNAHDILTSKDWEGAALKDLINTALSPFQTSEHRFVIDGPDVYVPSRLALSLMLALHELATNAVKYGALSNDEGRVLLSWGFLDGKPGRFWLRWEEVGGPSVNPPTRTGFGSRLLGRALGAELGGTAELEYRQQGVVLTVEAPLAE